MPTTPRGCRSKEVAEIPMVGEELAIGRAVRSLAEQLIAAGGDDLSDPPTAEEHLIGRI